MTMESIGGGSGNTPRGEGRDIVPVSARELTASALPEPSEKAAGALEKVLEGGALPHTDEASEKALDAILADSGRSNLMRRTMQDVPRVAKQFSWKLGAVGAGVASGYLVGTVIGSTLGKEYVRGKTEAYLSSSLVEPVRRLVQDKPPEYVAPDEMSILRLLELGKAVWDQGWHKASSAALPVVEKTAGGIAEAVGAMASVPGAIGGYIVLSFLAAGSIAAVAEYFRSKSFDAVADFITESENAIAKRPAQGEDDGRTRIIATFDQLLAGERPVGPKTLSREQWLLLASATRRAGLSLIRQQVEPPSINVFEGAAAEMEAQRVAVERLIAGEQDISEFDARVLAHTLESFRSNVAEMKGPESERLARERALFQQIPRYAQAFVRTGFTATGLPLIGKVFSTIFHPIQTTRKLATGSVRLSVRASTAGIRKGKEIINKRRNPPQDPLTPQL